MKIAAVFQFYMDARFPRDASWSVWNGLTLTAPSFTALVQVWKPAAEPLFPEDIDRSLSGAALSLVPLGQPGGAIANIVASMAVDRIRVELVWDEPDDARNSPLFDLELAQDRAVDAANVLIEHIRSAARAAWVPRVRRAWRPQDGNFYILTPWTVTVLDGDTAAPLAVFAGHNAQFSVGALRSPETGTVGTAAFEDSLRRGINPAIHASLLVDAEAAVESMALRESILSMASACESAASAYISSKAGTGAKGFQNSLRGTFAEKFYEHSPQNFSGRSFRQEDPSAFALVQEMYRERNNLMHGGSLTEQLNTLSSRERQRTAYAYLSAAGRAVDWITSL